MTSKIGLVLAGLYIAACAYLMGTQGIFGESFIALILGMPWTLLFAYFEFGGVEGPLLYVLIFLPILLNAIILYFIGSFIARLLTKQPLPPAQ